uniref:Nuclear transcription factor Y subunit gamma n=1 Tax=Anopheles epiroticus TaxID=199890 RepID=A0A182PBJ6_9DIPT
METPMKPATAVATTQSKIATVTATSSSATTNTITTTSSSSSSSSCSSSSSLSNLPVASLAGTATTTTPPGSKEQLTEGQRSLQSFWPSMLREIQLIESIEPGNQLLPLARIKKIMKLDEDVKMISSDAPLLFAKAIEIFIQELTLRAWLHTEHNKRRTLQRSDIAMAITKYDQFDFLIDIVPRDEIKVYKKEHESKSQDGTGGGNSSGGSGGAAGTSTAGNGTTAGSGGGTNGSDDMQYILQLAQQHQLTLQGKSLASTGMLANGSTVLDLATVISAANGQQLLQAGAITTDQGKPVIGGEAQTSSASGSTLQHPSTQTTIQTPSGQSIILANGTATTTGVPNGSATPTSPLVSANQSLQLLQHVMTPTGEIQQIPISIPQSQLNFIRTAGTGGGPNTAQPFFIQTAPLQTAPTIIHTGPTSVFLSANQLQQLQQQQNHNQTQQQQQQQQSQQLQNNHQQQQQRD